MWVCKKFCKDEFNFSYSCTAFFSKGVTLFYNGGILNTPNPKPSTLNPRPRCSKRLAVIAAPGVRLCDSSCVGLKLKATVIINYKFQKPITIGALITRIGFWCPLFYKYNVEPR